MFVAWILLLTLHVLASAAWFGAMFYSVTVLQPRAKAFFKSDAAFEEFTADIASGARWKVLSAFTLVGSSGLALVALYLRQGAAPWWIAIMAAKSALYLVALVIFCYGSWILWPRRIFAVGEEIPRFQRRFRRVGLTLLALVASSIVLGVIAHALAR